MTPTPSRASVLAACGLLVLGALAPARGQETPAASYDEWRLLEPAQELIDYKAKLKEGIFDDASKNFLLKTALPQLALPKNRPTIDRVRRRIREVLCGETGGDAKVAAQPLQVVADFMVALARDGKADVVTRCNAALLVGELRGPGGRPWTPAVAPLVAALGDESLPAAVRIAAAAGLARHVDADPAARAADVGPALLAVLRSPLAGVDPVAADWLRSQALTMLARMGPAAPNGGAAAAAALLVDAKRPVDLRVRAAAAVGGCVKVAADTDVAAAVGAIRGLAAAALDGTQAGIDRLDLAKRLAGAADAGKPEASPQLHRRDAWRLATLADALAPAAGESGLARVAGASAAAVRELAQALREAADLLDKQPDAGSLAAAIKGLAAVGTATTAAAATDATAPAAPPAGVDGVPFGEQ